MSHLPKTINFIIKRTPLLCGLLFAAMSISTQAQCTNWDASGPLEFFQRGQSRVNRMTLAQKGRVITGTASFVEAENNDPVFGAVDGTIDGDSFSIQIFWENGKTGVYNAKVLPSGRLDGEAYEKSSPQSRTIWHSVGVLKCAPPLPPAPKAIKSSGKARTQPAPSPPPIPPFIIASQAIIPTPNHPFGIVPLSWDGGPDHPNVEVWLSKDNAAEIPAFSMEQGPQSPVWKQPKISIALQLQRYHHYRFVLKDAGKTLSTAAFVVP